MSPLWSLVLLTRPDAAHLLTHGLRRDLLERVRIEPGVSLGRAAHALRVDPTTVRHHARLLERAGALVLVEEGRARRLYLPGMERRRAPAPRVLRALHAVREGAASPAALSRALDLPRGTAGSLLRALARAGLVERRGDEAWRLTAEAAAALAASGEGPSAS